jgi:hypothetical protein
MRWRARDTGIIELSLFVDGRVGRSGSAHIRFASAWLTGGGVDAQPYSETLLRAGPPMTFAANAWRVGLGYSCQYCGDERWGYFSGEFAVATTVGSDCRTRLSRLYLFGYAVRLRTARYCHGEVLRYSHGRRAANN